jgi:hypothetical protein
MSDWGLHRSWRQKRLFIWRWRKHSVCDLSFGRSLRTLVLSLGGLVVAFDLGRAAHAEEASSERAVYARAVEHCRGRVKRPMALDLDKRVLCFDGEILPEQNFALANGLAQGGLFVVRSFGGYAPPAAKLAEALRERDATIVVYDYCLSACASYLLFASTKAFVLRDTLVAWHHSTGEHLCPSIEQAKGGGRKRLTKIVCPDAPPAFQSGYKYYAELDDRFFGMRVFTQPFENPPQSLFVGRILKQRFGERGLYPPNLLWTWNPRYYARAIKARVIYEAYPQSQDEVDAMASRLGVRVIYDP